jgi:hypothetical protein
LRFKKFPSFVRCSLSKDWKVCFAKFSFGVCSPTRQLLLQPVRCPSLFSLKYHEWCCEEALESEEETLHCARCIECLLPRLPVGSCVAMFGLWRCGNVRPMLSCTQQIPGFCNTHDLEHCNSPRPRPPRFCASSITVEFVRDGGHLREAWRRNEAFLRNS